MKKIVITGGHFTPGLALIESLGNTWEIYWIGDDRAVSGTQAKTLESQVLPGLDVPFYKITTAKLQRTSKFASLLSFWKLGYGFFQSLKLLKKIKPNVVLSFGSYVSVPVALAALVLKVPVVVHEQTTASGLANRIVAKFATKIAISFPESEKYFPQEKTILVGNLVRKAIYKTAENRARRKANKTPILFITGGSRGAQSINQAVYDVLEPLLAKYEVYHQCGELDFDMLSAKAQTIAKSLKQNYHFAPNYPPNVFEEMYSKADVVLARSGANTISELAILGIPAILIPLPKTEQDEQAKNARMLQKIGVAEVIPQHELSGSKLLFTLENMMSNLESYSKNTKQAKMLVPEDACQKLIKILETADAKN